MSRYEDFDEDDGHYVVIDRSGDGAGIGTFLLGAAIGAGLALLFAPKSGAETRADIRRRARGARDSASRVAHDVTGKVTDTFQDARRRVEEQIDQAREAIEHKRDQVRDAMDAGRAAAEEARIDLEVRLAETKAAYNAGAQVARESRARRGAAASTASSLAEE
ncbi:MAG TPA: YtxH domain-containing protein [Gemmatimonadaceae bacterium]|nr:YtxH domain-containing protein [Gemmatimonadaceae bacterium]